MNSGVIMGAIPLNMFTAKYGIDVLGERHVIWRSITSGQEEGILIHINASDDTAIAMGGGAAVAAARGVVGGALGAIRAGTSMGTAASTAALLGRETGGSSIGGMAAAAKGAAAQKIGSTLGLGAAAERGRQAAWSALNGSSGSSATASAAGGENGAAAPAWARNLRAEQTARHRRQLVYHTLKDGDRGGASATPDIQEKE